MASKREMENELADLRREFHTHIGDTSTKRQKEIKERTDDLSKKLGRK